MAEFDKQLKAKYNLTYKALATAVFSMVLIRIPLFLLQLNHQNQEVAPCKPGIALM